MFSAYPRVLSSSLSNQIIPAYDFFSNLFRSDETLIAAVKLFPDILKGNIEKLLAPKIDILREHRVPDSKLVLFSPRVCVLSLDRFREIVEKVVEIRFDAMKLNFVDPVHVFMSMSKTTWESKVDAFKKWSWSEDDVFKAFQRHPRCMSLSEDKIMAGMDFFINKMGSRACLIARNPKLLSLSLKKRLMPRYLVFQILLSKGLVKKEVSLILLFDHPEKMFLKKFVEPYEKEAPELLKMYKEKLNLSNGLLVDKV